MLQAFIIEGLNKQYVLNANNEKNRSDWIAQLVFQSQEYRNPVRRFIRTGEVIHGIGLFSTKITKNNLLSVFKNRSATYTNKQFVRVVITNFPRIILIDPVNNTLKAQYTWTATTLPVLEIVSLSWLTIFILHFNYLNILPLLLKVDEDTLKVVIGKFILVVNYFQLIAIIGT